MMASRLLILTSYGMQKTVSGGKKGTVQTFLDSCEDYFIDREW